MRRVCKAKRAHASIGMRRRRAWARRKTRLCLPGAASARRHEFSTTGGLRDGNRKRGCAFYPPGETSVACECVMKDELTTILEAMRAAQGEFADYLESADRDAELTIAKLVGILDRR